MKATMPYQECPSFEACSCNNCPLDPEASVIGGKERFGLKNEEKCRAHKFTRKRVGLKYSHLLKYQGLTSKEWIGKQIYLRSLENNGILTAGASSSPTETQKTI